MIKFILKRFNDLNLLQKMLIAFFTVIILPTCISYFVSVRTTERLIIDQVSRDSLNSTSIVSNNIEDALKRIASTMLFIYNDKLIQGIMDKRNYEDLDGNGQKGMERKKEFVENVNNLISNTLFNAGELTNFITIFSADGEIFTNYNYDETSLKNIMSQYSVEKMQRMDNSVIWKGIEKNYVEPNDATNPYVITIAKTLDDGYGSMKQGVMLMSIREKSFSTLLDENSSDSLRVLVDGDMNVISSNEKLWLGKSFYEIYSSGFPADKSGCMTVKTNSGEKSVLSYRKMGISSWSVVDIKPYSGITRKISDTSRLLLIINLICVFVFIFIAIVSAKGITDPLRRLSKLMLAADLDAGLDSNEQHAAKLNGKEVKILKTSYDIMRKKIKELINENVDKEKRKREAELNALQAQISPHFLFNTLNTVRCAAKNGNNDKAANMVLALSNLLRMTLVKQDEFITLQQEFENLNNYIMIIKMRSSTVFDVSFSIEASLKDYLVPKLLLQPLVENVILHGFENLDRRGRIEIKAEYDARNTKVYIIDNGKGMESDPLVSEQLKGAKFSRFGVSNVNERIKLYYGEQYGLRFFSFPGKGTTAELTLPGDKL